ncbi:MAG: Ribosomal RNA small subunit methyltransferase H [Microgenomates group bacterium GW2011_GWC2_45_8]|nr:MAG: Ribosomal RNA small subunit methyltransferase H [Microgenomates group bacterium GW2011_GWC2_45_8]KKU26482.1 MAG: Ribosomal RNA small subunit methyltransferase H [Microgenomates group bacterium GW2011_GWA2_46_16]
MTLLHTPVLVKEVTEYLAPDSGKDYIDATLGYGGHTLELLQAGASVVGIDQDVDILELATARINEAGYGYRFTPIRSSFSSALSSDRLPLDHYAGILFDLGVSSYQLDTPGRGFSFRYDAPLDMRMDKTLGVTARDLVNGLGKKELVELFHTLGEEKAALKLAEKIVDQRKIKPIETTYQLADLITKFVPRHSKIHPATKVFQALRMAVNGEREELKAALPSALSHLQDGGVLAVIAFHSLEDAIVKDFFSHTPSLTNLTLLPIEPDPGEITLNPRSRSAKLRVGRKTV